MSHVKKPLGLAAALNTTIFIAEGFGGIKGHSNSLIMDGVHNFSDELAMVCLFLAYVLPIAMSKNFQRIANVLNSAGLIIISGLLIWQSIERIINPKPTIGYIPFIVGLLATVANWGVARILKPIKNQNAAIHLAYLHNLGDIYVSLAPVLAGILILVTHKSFFDPIIAAGIGIWLIWSTIKEISGSYNELIWPENAVCKHEDLEVVHKAK
jgi:cation diffusion facilitator family transporter